MPAARYVGPPPAIPLYPIPLEPGVDYHISIKAGSQQFFMIPGDWYMLVKCAAHALAGKVKLYAKRNGLPSLDDWDYDSDSADYGAAMMANSSPNTRICILVHSLADHRGAALSCHYLGPP